MTHTDDDIKAAEKRGYGRGYQARELRIKREALDAQHRRDLAHELRADRAFRDRAFLAALPFAMTQKTWVSTVGEEKKPISTMKQRVDLAWDVANEALKQRRSLT